MDSFYEIHSFPRLANLALPRQAWMQSRYLPGHFGNILPVYSCCSRTKELKS